MTSQALVKEGSKISDITQNFLNVFSIEKFNEDDRHEIEKIMENEKIIHRRLVHHEDQKLQNRKYG